LPLPLLRTFLIEIDANKNTPLFPLGRISGPSTHDTRKPNAFNTGCVS
jgi:hypothetical protein